MPTDNFEPLKLIRYERGQEFKKHFDVVGINHAARLAVTLFVYLNSCDEGEEKLFLLDKNPFFSFSTGNLMRTAVFM